MTDKFMLYALGILGTFLQICIGFVDADLFIDAFIYTNSFLYIIFFILIGILIFIQNLINSKKKFSINLKMKKEVGKTNLTDLNQLKFVWSVWSEFYFPSTATFSIWNVTLLIKGKQQQQ